MICFAKSKKHLRKIEAKMREMRLSASRSL